MAQLTELISGACVHHLGWDAQVLQTLCSSSSENLPRFWGKSSFTLREKLPLSFRHGNVFAAVYTEPNCIFIFFRNCTFSKPHSKNRTFTLSLIQKNIPLQSAPSELSQCIADCWKSSALFIFWEQDTLVFKTTHTQRPPGCSSNASQTTSNLRTVQILVCVLTKCSFWWFFFLFFSLHLNIYCRTLQTTSSTRTTLGK